MVVYEVVKGEDDERYEALEAANTVRQFGFLLSLIKAAVELEQTWLSHTTIKALNYHAIACLHDYAGQYRPCNVSLGDRDGAHKPPPPHAVPAKMEQFINHVNRVWEKKDPITLSAYVLWRLNHIHPFINGNGRTARAAAYYVLCLKMGGALPGIKTLPELLCENRKAYMDALISVDKSHESDTKLNLNPLVELLTSLLGQQINGSAVVSSLKG